MPTKRGVGREAMPTLAAGSSLTTLSPEQLTKTAPGMSGSSHSSNISISGGVTLPETNGASSLNPSEADVSNLEADLTVVSKTRIPALNLPSKASSGLVKVLKDKGQVEATKDDWKLRRAATRAIPE